ncbi:MAG: hypothetical protein EU530_11880 [Promethearchaeota archaeon]|nr:MAG: hypothetical protein EU530_11880 [Candidatus Lokiarchaeota archaeon]
MPSDKNSTNKCQGLTFFNLIGGEIVGALVHVTPVLHRVTDIIKSNSVGSGTLLTRYSLRMNEY